MRRLVKSSVLSIGLLSLLFFAGCGEGGPDRGQVSGVVTWNGDPVANATVSFLPVEGRGSVGTTDAQGAYSLAYAKGRTGALLGEHKITIMHDPNDVDIQPAKPLPEEFGDRARTPLKRTVEPGKNKFDIELNEAK